MNDDYLRIPLIFLEHFRTAFRFFSIASKLNLDLQIILCNRCFGNGKDHIKKQVRDDAFKKVIFKMIWFDLERLREEKAKEKDR